MTRRASLVEMLECRYPVTGIVSTEPLFSRLVNDDCTHRVARVCSHCDAIICNACQDEIEMRDDLAIQTVGYFCPQHHDDGIMGRLERGVFIGPRRELR